MYPEKADIRLTILVTLPILAVSFYVFKYFIHFVDKRDSFHYKKACIVAFSNAAQDISNIYQNYTTEDPDSKDLTTLKKPPVRRHEQLDKETILEN